MTSRERFRRRHVRAGCLAGRPRAAQHGLRTGDLGGSLQWRMAGQERVEMGLAFMLHGPD